MSLHGPQPTMSISRRRLCLTVLAPMPLASLAPAVPAFLSARRPCEEVSDGSMASPGAQAHDIASRLFSRALSLVPRISFRRAFARLRMSLAMHSAAGLRIVGPKPEENDKFRLNGLRWHHLAIAAHLHALHERVAAADDARVVENAFDFVLANVWTTYNTLERDVLFPWVAGGSDDDPRVARALSSFAVERDRIEQAAKRVHAAIRDIAACAEPVVHEKRKRRRRSEGIVAAVDAQQPQPSEVKTMATAKDIDVSDIARIAKDIKLLIEDAERLHRAERDILFPVIAARFSEEDQAKLTSQMIGAMDSGLARLQLVNYHETLKKDRNTEQLKRFQEEVPTPIRFLLPVWKARLYDTSPLADLHSRK